MKAGNRFGGWRPVLGVVVVGALACSVGVQGGPRVTDGAGARVKGQVKSDVTRLVTGDSARLNSVVAAPGAASLQFYFTPVPALPGTFPGLAYPAGATIVGQKLTVSGGGFISAWNAQISSWDPAQSGNPLLRSFQDKIDALGMMGACLQATGQHDHVFIGDQPAGFVGGAGRKRGVVGQHQFDFGAAQGFDAAFSVDLVDEVFEVGPGFLAIGGERAAHLHDGAHADWRWLGSSDGVAERQGQQKQGDHDFPNHDISPHSTDWPGREGQEAQA